MSDIKQMDKVYFSLIIVFIIFGLTALTSASAPVGYAQFGDTYYFIKKQILFGLLPGILFFYFCLRIDYHFWKKISWIVYVLSIVLLALVFIPNVGMVINGARSWIHFFGYSFQPAEFAKLAIIMMMATLLTDKKRNIHDFKNGLLPILLIILPSIILIVLQPDLGTLSILGVIIIALLFFAGVKFRHLSLLGGVAAGAFIVLLLIAPYRVQRLTVFLHPELDPKGVGYQINQSFLAVGSGGLWGLGLGHSRQKFLYLPEVHADSIFAVIAEEIGFIFTTIFLLLIGVIGLRGLNIAKYSRDSFGRLLAGGIMVWFIWQSFLNIGSMLGLLPLTGVPLPFVSHGGTALMIMMFASGIMLRISRDAKI